MDGGSNNKEFFMMIGEMHSDIKNILEQTRKTNGRVSALEDRVDENSRFISNWKGRIAVVYAVITVATIASWEAFKYKFFK